MAVFISTTTDSFEEVRSAERYNFETERGVRRPIRGIELKNESFAYIRAVKSNGEPILLLDGGARDTPAEALYGMSFGSTSFLLQQVSEGRTEKSQIVETFGEDFIFLFGERPRVIDCAGILMNTKDFNWKNEFLANYESTLRGTRLLEQDARVYLTYDDVMVEGYILSTSLNLNTGDPYQASFQFQLFVTNYMFLNPPGTVRIPGYDTDLPPDDLDQQLDRPPTYEDRDEYVYPGQIAQFYGEEQPPVGAPASGLDAGEIARLELRQAGVDADLAEHQRLLVGDNAFHGRVYAATCGILQARGSLEDMAGFVASQVGWELEPPIPVIELPEIPVFP